MSPRASLTVIQYPSMDRVSTPSAETSNLSTVGNIDLNLIQNVYGSRSIAFTSVKCPESCAAHSQFWTPQKPPLSDSSTGVLWKGNDSMPIPLRWMSQHIYDKLLIHFLPAQYPNSVQQPGYTYYASYGFIASVAGSASMVLSTQTLLCTMMSCSSVGEQSVMTTDTVSVVAGALNWVLKDGIGQLGGILVASYMGQMRSLDSNPKRYRMFAAILLDVAAIIELSTPLGVMMVSPSTVVPMACVATLCKNLGFIMASASRATIHQSLCVSSNSIFTNCAPSSAAPAAISNNLADLTAKFSSQGTAAGLLGTLLGISISTYLPVLGNPRDLIMFNYSSPIVILGLVIIHQTCNYMALRSVALYHLNRQRLGIILNHYIQRLGHDEHELKEKDVAENVLSPIEVAEREFFLPQLFFFSTRFRHKSTENDATWLKIGCPLESICPKGSEQLMALLAACDNEQYILNVDGDACDGQIQLVFLEQANGNDIIRGMLHAYVLRDSLMNRRAFVETQSINKNSLDDNKTLLPMINRSHLWVQSKFHGFVERFRTAGWNTNLVIVEEGARSFRLAFMMDDDGEES